MLPRPKSLLAALIALAAALPLAAADSPKETPAGKPTLVFFMNPAGRPCQTQDQILKDGKARWEPRATLKYVRTDVPGDREAFYRYGVRALPSLVLVAPDGKEIHRYSPGIQDVDAILAGFPAR